MIAHVVRGLYTCVLPDNAEETGEGHEFGLWVQRLREAGVEVTADELRAVPYRVILSDGLRVRLGLRPHNGRQ